MPLETTLSSKARDQDLSTIRTNQPALKLKIIKRQTPATKMQAHRHSMDHSTLVLSPSSHSGHQTDPRNKLLNVSSEIYWTSYYFAFECISVLFSYEISINSQITNKHSELITQSFFQI
jgi:hypothetical protein